MRILKKLFLFLIILSVIAVAAVVYVRQVVEPRRCLSGEVDVHHPDYVRCGPIVEQDLLAKAQNGDMEAAYKLALLYDVGDRVPENRERAIYWLQKAEQANLADAQYVMAVWAERKYFGASSQDLVLPMYEAAARQGHLNAMKSLANIYRDIDPDKHAYWMKRIRRHK
ncbi:MAG: sel1 repeat family protein [Alphaproteobacteria bacterium]|nr:sel1 repeat family protein [Alphaproteobacteria bacterium]